MRTLSSLLLLFILGAGRAYALDAHDCDADRERLFGALAENRDKGLRHIDDALLAAGSEQVREQLRNEQLEAWQQEELGRGLADVNWRDCLRHVGVTPGSRRQPRAQ